MVERVTPNKIMGDQNYQKRRVIDPKFKNQEMTPENLLTTSTNGIITPFQATKPAQLIRKQLNEFSEDGLLKCSEPIMLIIGGDPCGLLGVRAYVHPKGKDIYIMDKYVST
jgi:hypothetical protein